MSFKMRIFALALLSLSLMIGSVSAQDDKEMDKKDHQHKEKMHHEHKDDSKEHKDHKEEDKK